MAIDILKPNINGSDEQQLKQMQDYMFQLVDQLNFALNTVTQEEAKVTADQAAGSNPIAKKDAEALAKFNEIKGLIIKSGDVVNALTTEISKHLEGKYVVQSDFGSYVEETSADLIAASDGVTQNYANIQTLIQNVSSANDLIDQIQSNMVEAYGAIRSGQVGVDQEGLPVYGIMIGQRTIVDGTETFRKYTQITSDGMYFYTNGSEPVAYMSDQRLYITNLVVTDTVKFGKFIFDTSNGLALVWAGGIE